MIGPWATAERSEKSRSWARRHIGEKGDDAVQSYYNGVRILSGSGFQASIVAVVSMMFPKEEFHLDQQKEFLPFHFTTDLRYFTEPEFQREIPIQMLEQRYANENAIWDAAACGNTEAALKACQQMARFTYGGRFFGSLYQTKIMLTVMNTLLRKAIERSNIHPYYIDEISSRYALMIENMVDEESWPLVQTMVKEYCAYVRRYSLQQYSPLVQKVINTINLNLSDQLSPKSLAAMYYISPSYLSSLFKQDTGTTLTDFINTQRIQRAANLLSTTEQNISVVAEQVGILDLTDFDPRHHRAELGIVIKKEFQGQGYAKASVSRLLQYARNILHLQQIYAIVGIRNQKAAKMLQSVGFEGNNILKQWLCGPVGYEDAMFFQYFL